MSLTTQSDLEKEAIAISTYLVGKPCSKILVDRYILAHQKQTILIAQMDQKMWNWTLKSRFRMACIDSGLALTQPKSPIRRKIFTMLAILEASVDFTDYFLPASQPALIVFLKLVFQGTKAVACAIIGFVLVKLR